MTIKPLIVCLGFLLPTVTHAICWDDLDCGGRHYCECSAARDEAKGTCNYRGGQCVRQPENKRSELKALRQHKIQAWEVRHGVRSHRQ